MKFLAPLAGLLLVSCASEASRQARWDSIRKASLSVGLCSIHHVPLEHTVVYGYSRFDTTIFDPGLADYRAQDKYPNALSYTIHRTRSADFHHREFATYCPVCQERYERDTRQ
jgi:hypothetical protein